MYTVTSAYFNGYLNPRGMSVSLDKRDARSPTKVIFLNHRQEELRHHNCSRNIPQLRDNIILLGYDTGYTVTRFRVAETEQVIYDELQAAIIDGR